MLSAVQSRVQSSPYAKEAMEAFRVVVLKNNTTKIASTLLAGVALYSIWSNRESAKEITFAQRLGYTVRAALMAGAAIYGIFRSKVLG